VDRQALILEAVVSLLSRLSEPPELS
jgi:hypothetical protein